MLEADQRAATTWDYASAAGFFAVMQWKALDFCQREAFPSSSSSADRHCIYVADASLDVWKHYWKAESNDGAPRTRRWKFNEANYYVPLSAGDDSDDDDGDDDAATIPDQDDYPGCTAFHGYTALTDTPFAEAVLATANQCAYVFDWCAPVPANEAYLPPELPVRFLTREPLRRVDPRGAPLEPPSVMTLDGLKDYYWDSSEDEEDVATDQT
ncbi:hypothetical protein SYNPS1DRAFT_31490 [Syncephalis pseudoplumigaleata]|uniref:Uncharacterized protein n=1 Tax=Syncephalis pseudoplumigaleata TaxID=1712513 RepID=A0A4P9YSD2_9FUNG|nr:hypothetical protein SYNPS1DRAFT_31490 [Syncephalis pseudoplumigaleata]|eukprot:RKP22843.1 hypothetical protein SYNPS1DRAFT_31490 [Syncephalis pseudoplumigaleata]